MRLIDCLKSYWELSNRLPMRHWGGVDATEPLILDHSCCYCHGSKATTCTHHQPLKVRNKEGDLVFPRSPVRPLASEPATVRLTQLLADIDRQIDGMPDPWLGIFDRLYRQASATPDDIMAELGIRQPEDFTRAHDHWVEAMERRLIDWFPAAREEYRQREHCNA